MSDLKYNEALFIIGGLSAPSKMPWFGWSTSAFDCITGTKLREVKGSTCASCYACKGNYMFPNVRTAHNRRLKALEDPRFTDAFITVLNSLYEKTRKTYTKDGQQVRENRFRWHDSGDLQSVEHLIMINNIALATPQIDHWLPTREFGMVKEFLKENSPAPNLTIRMSAVMVGQDFGSKPMGLSYSTVGVESEAVQQCPAYTQGGKCLDCSSCWDNKKNVNYPKH